MSHSIVSGILGVGLRRAYIRVTAVYIYALFGDILVHERGIGNNYVVSYT